jgi:GNAT superfamily N-acetyltransferase
MLDKDGLTAEVSVGVTYSALMSAVSLFFTGVVISQYNNFDQTIKVPLIFLIISTFSFIFSATIYTNAGSEITLNKLRVVEKYMIYGKNLTELLGLYPFILATPMVIGAITNDSFLRTSTILVALTGFALYSQSKFSVLDKELKRQDKRWITSITVLLSLLLYYFQTLPTSGSLFIYSFLSVIMLSLIIGIAYKFSAHSKQYKPVYFREYAEGDAAKLTEIVRSNLAGGKAKQLGNDITTAVREQFSVDNISIVADQKQVFVSEYNDRVVGFAILSGNEVSGIFTDPDLHRKSIGRLLVDYIESVVKNNGDKQILAKASQIDHGFYLRLGYRESKRGDDGTITMQKPLR